MIIVTGTVAYDYIMEFPGKFGDHILPDQTHNINLSFIVDKFAKRRGGTAGNVSYTLGLLTVPHVLYTVAGKDFEEYRRAFNKIGIDTAKVVIDSNLYTATGFAMTDKTNNQIWGYFYGAASGIPQLNLKKVVKKKDLVLIGPQGAVGSMAMIRQCIDLGVSYMFDPGFILTQVSDEDLRTGLSSASYIIGNEYEIVLMRKRIKDWSSIAERKTIITTLGEKGALIEIKGKKISIKPVPSKSVVSTTGAGDAWRGGFLAGIAHNYDLQICGQIGSVASSYVLGHYGTQEHSFSKKEFQKRYRQIYGSLIKL